MERLNEALKLVGITEKTPSHVTHNLLLNIFSLAVSNADSELETACDSMMKSIRPENHSGFCRCDHCLEILTALDLDSGLKNLFDFRYRVFDGEALTNLKLEIQKFNEVYPQNDRDFKGMLSLRIGEIINDKKAFMQNRRVLEVIEKLDSHRASLTLPSLSEYLKALVIAFVNRKGYRKISAYSAIDNVKYTYQGCKVEIEERATVELTK